MIKLGLSCAGGIHTYTLINTFIHPSSPGVFYWVKVSVLTTDIEKKQLTSHTKSSHSRPADYLLSSLAREPNSGEQRVDLHQSVRILFSSPVASSREVPGKFFAPLRSPWLLPLTVLYTIISNPLLYGI